MSIINNYPVNGANPVIVGGTGTTPKYFQAPSANFTSGVTPNPGPSASSGYGAMSIPGSNVLAGQYFTIRASGNFEVGSGGACPNVTIEMVANTGTNTSPIWTTLATTGAVTAQNATGIFYPWFLAAACVGDSASGTLTGTYSGSVDNNNVAATALAHTLSGLNFAANPVFTVAMRVTFSVSESGNSASLYSFYVDAA